MKARIAFISAMEGSPWGGSELLWSRAALKLAKKKHRVCASVKYWPQPARPINDLIQNNIVVHTRRSQPAYKSSIIERFKKRFGEGSERNETNRHWKEVIAFSPNLVCISQGSIACGTPWARQCLDYNIPYTLIAQSNTDRFWPGDSEIESLQKAYKHSQMNFFVSEENKVLLEKQIGIDVPNAVIIRNPFSVSYQDPPPWPTKDQTIRLACVGRLEPSDKGQDLLIEALSTDAWRGRDYKLSLYGNGRCQETIRHMITRYGLQEKVSIVGHIDNVEDIWRENHALVLPSRSEGLPLALVEACLCERVIITTDVAGNAELLSNNVNAFIASAATKNHLLEAMERAWSQRKDWQHLGKLAGSAVREKVSPEPEQVFADLLLELISQLDNRCGS